MDNIVRQAEQCLWLCLAVLLFASCTDSEEQAEDVRDVQIRFTLTMGNTDTNSRADTWGESYDNETATEWESYIYPGSLQVLVYKDDTCLDTVTVSSISRHIDEKNVYDIEGYFKTKVSDTELEDGKLPCKLVVFANSSKYMTDSKAVAGFDAMRNITYSFDPNGMKAGTTYIPMWGVRTYSSENTDERYKPLPIEKGTYDAGVIYMLRSMAKIRVKLDDEVAKEYTLSDVSLSNYSYYGYITPYSCDVSDTEKLSHEIVTNDEIASGMAFQSFHPYTANNARLTLPFKVETAGSSYFIYVPEFDTTLDTTNGDTDPSISLTLTPKNLAKSSLVYKVPLTDDTGTAAQKLMRNTIYNYKVVGTDLAIEYQAVEWSDRGGEVTFK